MGIILALQERVEELKAKLEDQQKFEQFCNEQFTKADVDQNGYISKEEFKNNMDHFVAELFGEEIAHVVEADGEDFSMSQEDANKIVDEMDTNHDGRLDKQEFATCMRVILTEFVAGIEENPL